MVQFPKTVVYDDTNKPEWITLIKENNADPFGLELTMEDWNKIAMRLTNIEGLLVNLERAVADTGLTATDIMSLISFLRFTARNIILTLDGAGTDSIEILMPPGIVISEVRKITGERVPFFFNQARNSIVVTVQYASPVVVEMLVRSIQTTLNTAVTSITSIMVVSAVLQTVAKAISEVAQEVRKA